VASASRGGPQPTMPWAREMVPGVARTSDPSSGITGLSTPSKRWAGPGDGGVTGAGWATDSSRWMGAGAGSWRERPASEVELLGGGRLAGDGRLLLRLAPAHLLHHAIAGVVLHAGRSGLAGCSDFVVHRLQAELADHAVHHVLGLGWLGQRQQQHAGENGPNSGSGEQVGAEHGTETRTVLSYHQQAEA